jgi:hypothetical protein
MRQYRFVLAAVAMLPGVPFISAAECLYRAARTAGGAPMTLTRTAALLVAYRCILVGEWFIARGERIERWGDDA